MPPRKELCRNFARGSCQYGDRCKFLHVSPQPSKPNPFGFGTQNGNQYQHTNFQQPKPNHFGFNVQNSPHSRGASDFGSKQNQFKPFENKWTRSSPSNTNVPAGRHPDNQPTAPSHTCTDPESCKRQIVEDFKQETPLWKLTCYGHNKNGPCDIIGDISYEELRATAYDDAKQGMNLQSIVERERSLVNSRVLEFEGLLRNPYKGPPSSGLGSPSPFSSSAHTAAVTTGSMNLPSFSSFSQLGASLNTAPAATPNNLFGQSNLFQNNSQTSTTFPMNNSQFQSSGFGGQTHQTFQSPFSSNFTSFNNSLASAMQNQVSTSSISSQISGFGQMSTQNGPDLRQEGVGLSTNFQLSSGIPSEKTDGDSNIWTKEEWSIGEIPEEAPPDKYC